MTAMPIEFAAIAQPTPNDLALSGCWTARGIGAIQHQLESVHVQSEKEAIADGSLIKALDTAGAWVLQKLLLRLQGEGIKIPVRGLRPEFVGSVTGNAPAHRDSAESRQPVAS